MLRNENMYKLIDRKLKYIPMEPRGSELISTLKGYCPPLWENQYTNPPWDGTGQLLAAANEKQFIMRRFIINGPFTFLRTVFQYMYLYFDLSNIF